MTAAHEIAAALRLRPVPLRREWRGDCPSCGYAAGLVLAEKDGRALWWCAGCQDRGAVTAAVRRALGGAWTRPAHPAPRIALIPSSASRTALARALWDEAQPLRPCCPADRYLAGRALPEVRSAALRYHPRAPHPGGARLPAMLAAVRDPCTGALLAVHRTFLHPDGTGKAAVEPAKASLGPMAGGTVLLNAPQSGAPLVIAEGIETALAAGRLLGAPAWAAVSAGNLAALALPPPATMPDVVIAAEADAPGRRAAWAAAHRWRAEGRRVRVATPDDAGADFNDLLMRRAMAAPAAEVEHG